MDLKARPPRTGKLTFQKKPVNGKTKQEGNRKMRKNMNSEQKIGLHFAGGHQRTSLRCGNGTWKEKGKKMYSNEASKQSSTQGTQDTIREQLKQCIPRTGQTIGRPR